MGAVDKAEDRRLHRAVGLKFLPNQVSRPPAALKRFRREAQAASALNPSNNCAVYDLPEQDGRQFITVELLGSQTLKRPVSGEELPLEQVLDLGIEIADALEAVRAGCSCLGFCAGVRYSVRFMMPALQGTAPPFFPLRPAACRSQPGWGQGESLVARGQITLPPPLAAVVDTLHRSSARKDDDWPGFVGFLNLRLRQNEPLLHGTATLAT